MNNEEKKLNIPGPEDEDNVIYYEHDEIDDYDDDMEDNFEADYLEPDDFEDSVFDDYDDDIDL